MPFRGKGTGCTFNTRSLFAYDINKYAAKLRYIAKIAKEFLFVALQEAHCQEGDSRFLAELLGPGFLLVWADAVGGGRAGGMGICVNSLLMAFFRCWVHQVL